MKDNEEILLKACTLVKSPCTFAGFLPVRMLISCPSARAEENPSVFSDRGTYIIVGLFHDPKIPSMDYWEEGSSTSGDRELVRILKSVCSWFGSEHGIDATVIPYQITDGGIYLKDAAVLAGLGVMGKNNLVLVPGFGPRVRFRAAWVDLETEKSVKPALLVPCTGCDQVCMMHCPMGAFPGGRYSRALCMDRMNSDKQGAIVSGGPVDHCRVCEVDCPGWQTEKKTPIGIETK